MNTSMDNAPLARKIKGLDEVIPLRIAGRRSSDGGYNSTPAWSLDGRRQASTNWDSSVTL